MSPRRFFMHYYDHIPKIQYEGSKSLNPFAFKYYDPKEMIFGKPMKDHLKFSLAYWHTLNGEGIDPFGKVTMERE
jgi:xylose isomerase